jgi:hypothetical protein
LDDKNPFEIHVISERSRLESAKLCLKSGDPESALVIVSSFIESEINTLIRLALRLRNFSHSAISDSLKETDLRTKMSVIIPLLQIKMSERQKQIAIEQNKVRNIILHFKAIPDISHDGGHRRVIFLRLEIRQKPSLLGILWIQLKNVSHCS